LFLVVVFLVTKHTDMKQKLKILTTSGAKVENDAANYRIFTKLGLPEIVFGQKGM